MTDWTRDAARPSGGPMIRAAQVGYDWWGRAIAAALRDSALIRPIVVVEPDPAARAAASAAGHAAEAELAAALARPDVEAVILCSPHRFHAGQIVAAAAAGKYVFCAKPLRVTLAEAEAAVAAARAAGVVLGIGRERRFEPAVIEMRARLAAGELGAPLLFEGNFSQDKFFALPKDNWRLSPVQAPVGPLPATGIHLVDLAIALFGRPERVWAPLATLGGDFANGDTLSVSLAFPSGASATLNAVLATPFAGRIALYGSQGWIEIRDRSHPENPTGREVVTACRGAAPATEARPPHPSIRDNLEAFARAAQGGPAYPVTEEELLANAARFEAICRSAASGRIEAVPPSTTAPSP
jgi:predicted dehydrogenase